jgi:hypothetical protein
LPVKGGKQGRGHGQAAVASIEKAGAAGTSAFSAGYKSRPRVVFRATIGGMSDQIVPLNQIQARIIILRGHRVLLDRDLALFYGVPTKVLNQAVWRNEDRFPADFRFMLTNKEVTILRSQIVTSKRGHGGLRYRPSAFTEHGILMAATVLNSPRAVQMSIAIVRVFAALRRMVTAQKELAEKLAELDARVGAHDEQLAEIVGAIRQLLTPPESEHNRKIGFHQGNR